MLQLKNIVKHYTSGDTTVEALKGIDLTFRNSEFVSILGQSGCGKTTLLNIVGGLDKYTSGDLVINGVSTKKYKDSDWDTYRNHTIGFVFQSYNLIPHQTVLSNVELALTLSGVSKSERRRRAIEVLEKVGLGDQLHKKPNQMSGGQMQRVAIARALVNNPDILLADEPTGALDSATSIQIMELLKEIAKDRLIIMVTHNPELAQQYSTRIIKLLDGKVIDDSNPYTAKEEKSEAKKNKKTSMSFLTAMSLSFNNLMTKKGRTILTAFAGSIGIIGIALILSLSSGFNAYIKKVEEDTLSSYPINIVEEQVDMSSMMVSMMGAKEEAAANREDGKIYSNNIVGDMLNAMMSEVTVNNLRDFKAFIEDDANGFDALVSDIKYGYSTVLNIYVEDTTDKVVQVNPSTVMDSMGMGSLSAMSSSSSAMMGGSQMNVWKEMLGNQELLSTQYDVIAGRWPENYNEVVLIVDENNQVSDYSLYAMGLKDQSEVADTMQKLAAGEEVTNTRTEYTYDQILGLKYRLVINTDFYEYNADTDTYTDIREMDSEDALKTAIANGVELKIVGIVRPNPEAAIGKESGSIGYTTALTEYVINQINASEIVKKQIDNPDIDVIMNKPFAAEGEEVEMEMTFDMSTLTPEQQAYMATLSEEELAQLMEAYMQPAQSASTYESNMEVFGVADLDSPSSIDIYPIDFNSKDLISDKIEEYNNSVSEENKIHYTDYIGLMMSSVSTIINAITYVLIAFVAISLVVSSIMIGIITYISVLERTKEIGILRSIGASKHDISRVFNAETLIVGFVSGSMGILITVLLNIPINAVIKLLSGIPNVAGLPPMAGAILVAISMLLTFIAGLIPSKVAAKKDPVVALRTE